MHHCKRCGELTAERKYCRICKPNVEKEQNRIRQAHYREKHREELRKSAQVWAEEHPEQKKLNARNYIHRHPDRIKKRLNDWRSRNPDLVRKQNKRARRIRIRKQQKNLYLNGIHPRIKHKLMCPKCGYRFKSSAKRPQCSKCNYHFPRDYFKKLIEKKTICKGCGREVQYQGRGRPHIHCDSCFPQFQALKTFFRIQRFKERNPKYDFDYYRDKHEVIVAVTCRVCGVVVLYKGSGKIPQKCGLCKCIERSRPKPLLAPKDVKRFIEFERHRLGLNGHKRWTASEIQFEWEHWSRNRVWEGEPVLYTTDED